LGLLAACAPVIQPALPREAPRGALRMDAEELAECSQPRGLEPPDDPEPLDPALVQRLSELPADVRRVARAAGIDGLLAQWSYATSHDDRAADELKLELVMRMSSLEIQVATLLFETQCFGAQMDATVLELRQRQRSREVGLAVSSILVGAVAATAGGIWDLRAEGPVGPASLVIGGGVASASLGIAAFVPQRRAVLFPHPRNLLTPIMRGEDPDGIYPRFVFRMLLAPAADGGASVRDEILEDWRRIVAQTFPLERRALAESVLYGRGGVYDADLLDAREQMFDALEAHVSMVNHDLDTLYRYTAGFSRTATAPASP
jgi:hypothetical protein